MIAQGKVEKIEKLPDMSEFSQKPMVYLQTSSGPTGYYDALKRVTEESRLFPSLQFRCRVAPRAAS